MADDISQIVDGLRIITAQKSIEDEASGTKTKGKKGVIIDSKAGNKKSREKEKPVSATLTSNETTRYTKIFEILRNVINPDPEAARTGDTSAKDKVKGMSATTEGAAGAKEAEGGLLEKLGALGALLATLGPLLWGLIKKKFFEYMGKFLKFLKGAFVKLFKGIGRLLAKFGRFLFNGAKKAAKAIWRGLKKVGRRLLGFLKNAASKVGGAIKGMFSALWNSKWANALKGAVKGAFNSMKGFLSKALNMVKGGAKAVASSASAAVNAARGGGGGGGGSSRGFWGTLYDKGSNLVKSGIDKTKSAIKTTVKAVKAAPGVIKQGLQSGVNMVKSGVKYTKGAVQYVGGKILKGVGQAKTALGKVLKPALKTGSRKLLTKIPIVGSALEAAFTAYDVNQYADNPELGIEELKTKIGNRVVKGVGGVAGGAMAAALVNGVPGGILVSIPAYMIGDYLGRFVADQLTQVFPMTKLGGVVMDAFGITPASSPEEVASQVKKVEDGVITHGGQTVRINSRDDVLALKTGGPLDSFLKSKDSNGIQDAAVFNDIKSVNIAQLQILTSIRDGIMALGRAGQASTSSGPSTVNLKPNLATIEYYA